MGGLACHLGRRPVTAASLLTAYTELPMLTSADDHYARAPWVQEGPPAEPLEEDVADLAEAALGPDALVERVSAARQSLAHLLDNGRAGELVGIPWQGWSLRRPEFLLTRMLEIVVHSDDLAVSLAIDLPAIPDEVFAPVRDLLTRLAVRRHGQSPVISTLSRRERAVPLYAF